MDRGVHPEVNRLIVNSLIPHEFLLLFDFKHYKTFGKENGPFTVA